MNKRQSVGGLMSKGDMMRAVADAITHLEKAYTSTAFYKDVDGRDLCKRTAQNKRSIYKNKLCIAYLLDELIKAVPDTYAISNENCQLGFDRLTEV